MEALIVTLCIIIIALVVLCLKFSKESKPKSEQIIIEVYKHDGEYYAQIRGRSEIYATGNTFYDAVGELVNSNREIFKVEYLGAIPLQRETNS